MIEDILQVGEYVTRDGRKTSDPIRRGVIVSVYQSRPNHIGETTTQYDVRWDDNGLVERGYLRIGLKREPLIIA